MSYYMIKNNVKVFFSLYISLNDKKGAKDICLKTRCTKKPFSYQVVHNGYHCVVEHFKLN